MAGCLLLDENLSPRLASALETHFPGSMHVRDVGLKGESDHQILRILVERVEAIEAFINEPSTALLALRKS